MSTSCASSRNPRCTDWHSGTRALGGKYCRHQSRIHSGLLRSQDCTAAVRTGRIDRERPAPMTRLAKLRFRPVDTMRADRLGQLRISADQQAKPALCNNLSQSESDPLPVQMPQSGDRSLRNRLAGAPQWPLDQACAQDRLEKTKAANDLANALWPAGLRRAACD